MPELSARRRLDQPSSGRRRLSFDFDPDSFGRFSERLARFMGTGKFLMGQTVFVAVWIALNLVAAGLRWDPYPFILLNLAFSTQAAYAAPLILLAQNRQDDRDRISLDEDRSRARQTKADTEYLARELAALRVAIGEVATRDYLRGEIEKLRGDLDDLMSEAVARIANSPQPAPPAETKKKSKPVARSAKARSPKPTDRTTEPVARPAKGTKTPPASVDKAPPRSAGPTGGSAASPPPPPANPPAS